MWPPRHGVVRTRSTSNGQAVDQVLQRYSVQWPRESVVTPVAGPNCKSPAMRVVKCQCHQARFREARDLPRPDPKLIAPAVMVGLPFVCGDGKTGSALDRNASGKCAFQWRIRELSRQTYQTPSDHAQGNGLQSPWLLLHKPALAPKTSGIRERQPWPCSR